MSMWSWAVQFQWKSAGSEGGCLLFQTPSGNVLKCVLKTSPKEDVSSICIGSQRASLTVERENGSPLLNAIRKDGAGTTTAHFTAGCRDVQSLLTEEMIPGAKHRVYMKALAGLQSLL